MVEIRGNHHVGEGTKLHVNSGGRGFAVRMFLEGSPEARSHVGGVLPQIYGRRGVFIVLVPATLRRGGRREDRGGRLCHGCRSLGWRRSSQSRRRCLGQGLGRFRPVRGFRRAGGPGRRRVWCGSGGLLRRNCGCWRSYQSRGPFRRDRLLSSRCRRRPGAGRQGQEDYQGRQQGVSLHVLSRCSEGYALILPPALAFPLLLGSSQETFRGSCVPGHVDP